MNNEKRFWQNCGNELFTRGESRIQIAVCSCDVPNRVDGIANATLIRTAINGCKHVNAENPIGVAREIPNLAELLQTLADGKRNREMLIKEMGMTFYRQLRDTLQKIGERE